MYAAIRRIRDIRCLLQHIFLCLFFGCLVVGQVSRVISTSGLSDLREDLSLAQLLGALSVHLNSVGL